MKKKYATLIMGKQYDPALHQACFETERLLSYTFTVRDFEEAKARALWCLKEGFGALELCGAFGADRAKELIALTEGKLVVGYVVNTPQQDAMVHTFFSDCDPDEN